MLTKHGSEHTFVLLIKLHEHAKEFGVICHHQEVQWSTQLRLHAIGGSDRFAASSEC